MEEEKKELIALPAYRCLPILNCPIWLPKLEMLDLNLFFGTKSEPLVNSDGEVPEEIEEQTKIEEPMEDSIEEVSPMESVEKDDDVTEAEVVLNAKQIPSRLLIPRFLNFHQLILDWQSCLV